MDFGSGCSCELSDDISPANKLISSGRVILDLFTRYFYTLFLIKNLVFFLFKLEWNGMEWQKNGTGRAKNFFETVKDPFILFEIPSFSLRWSIFWQISGKVALVTGESLLNWFVNCNSILHLQCLHFFDQVQHL